MYSCCCKRKSCDFDMAGECAYYFFSEMSTFFMNLTIFPPRKRILPIGPDEIIWIES